MQQTDACSMMNAECQHGARMSRHFQADDAMAGRRLSAWRLITGHARTSCPV